MKLSTIGLMHPIMFPLPQVIGVAVLMLVLGSCSLLRGIAKTTHQFLTLFLDRINGINRMRIMKQKRSNGQDRLILSRLTANTNKTINILSILKILSKLG